MNAHLTARAAGRERDRQQWAYGLGLMLVAALLVVLPTVARLSRGLRDLRRIHETYDQKLSWAGSKGELERRVREQEAATAELDARLLTSAGVAQLTKAINAAARAAGCSVLSIHPADPRVLPRPKPKDGEDEPAVERVQWRVSVAVQGEYAQISALLARLRRGPWHLQVWRLAIRPSGEDCEALSCELELAGCGLRPLAEKS